MILVNIFVNFYVLNNLSFNLLIKNNIENSSKLASIIVITDFISHIYPLIVIFFFLNQYFTISLKKLKIIYIFELIRIIGKSLHCIHNIRDKKRFTVHIY